MRDFWSDTEDFQDNINLLDKKNIKIDELEKLKNYNLIINKYKDYY